MENNLIIDSVRCRDCFNYLSVNKCLAFDVIPDEILHGTNQHDKPLPDQKNTIVFEDIEKVKLFYGIVD